MSNPALFFPQIEGLGTTYEAYITSQFLAEFVMKHGIESICEYPVCTFRVPGVIGIQMALRGCDVSLASTNAHTLQKAEFLSRQFGVQNRVHIIKIGKTQLKSESFDLVFHISLLPTMRRDLGLNPSSCLREMVRIAKQYLLITNHNLHYSVPLDKLLSWITRSSSQFGDVALIGSTPVTYMLRTLGLVIRERFFFDMPPWMAIDLSKLFPNLRKLSTQGIDQLANQSIKIAMEKYAFIERSSLPSLLKGLVAHHVAIVAEKSPKKCHFKDSD